MPKAVRTKSVSAKPARTQTARVSIAAAGNIDNRIDELMARMTLTEKIGQLHQIGYADEKKLPMVRKGMVGSVCNMAGAAKSNMFQRVAINESRLGIPLLMGRDVIHGYRTVFPIPLGQAASWDGDLIRRAAQVAAAEARADGIAWTFTPMLDIARDARWGRIAEGFGEDPYLCSALARQAVVGYQGESLDRNDTLLACAKHYVAYGAAEGGRDYNTVDVSQRRLREVYLPPFQAAVEAGVGSVMSSFNEVNGVSSAANRWLLQDVLRDEWGFEGFVVSDWNAIGELLLHGLADNLADASELTLRAGVDLDMTTEGYLNELEGLVKSGRVPMKMVDAACRRMLRSKFMLGLFDRPYVDEARVASVLLCDEHVAVAREAVAKCTVLLKNEGNVLPLGKSARTIAVVGPMAKCRADLYGTWTLDGKDADGVSVVEGVSAAAKGARILTADTTDQAVKAAAMADVAIVVVGEEPKRSGEAHCISELCLPEGQDEFIKAVHATGTPIVLVLIHGRPLAINWIAENVPAILAAWHPGSQGGNGIADLIFGRVNPSAKLPVTFPRNAGQIPIYYAHKNTGRPPGSGENCSVYLDIPHTPLYPFGHGLSYTRFEYSDLKVSPKRIGPAGSVTVSATVANVGRRAGEEVVQLYIHDVVGSTSRPVKELRGFHRIALDKGESRRVSFKLGPKELACYDSQMKLTVEPGEFQVWLGPSSEEGLLGQFEVTKK